MSKHGSGVSRWLVVGTRRIALAEGENVMGRDPTALIQLDAAGISRRHARILVVDARALIEDLASKNGTMVNDQPVTGQLILHDGDLSS